MVSKIHLKDILFLDIETVPEVAEFSQLDETKKNLFDKKTTYQRKEEIPLADFYERAGIWAEFGKIICISVGNLIMNNNRLLFRTKSFYGDIW